MKNKAAGRLMILMLRIVEHITTLPEYRQSVSSFIQKNREMDACSGDIRNQSDSFEPGASKRAELFVLPLVFIVFMSLLSGSEVFA